MRIEERRSREIDTKKKRASSSSPVMPNQIFSAILQEEEEVNETINIELDSLREEIAEAGDALEKEPSMEEFNHFRDLIKALTEKVTKEAYRLKTVGFYRKRQYVQYKIISTIDEELSSLYKLIISENKNHLAIAGKIISLKGLVLDILS